MFNSLDILVFSSHKTATQTLVKTFRGCGYTSRHLHRLANQKGSFQIPSYDTSPTNFLHQLQKYHEHHGKKLQVVSVLRDPFDRSLSFFFQRHHDSEMTRHKLSPSDTTIMTRSVSELMNLYKHELRHADSSVFCESLLEWSEIFKVDIFSVMEDRGDHYYWEGPHCTLHVLYFRLALDRLYLQRVLNLSIPAMVPANVSHHKKYGEKYEKFCTLLRQEEEKIRRELVHPLYPPPLLPFFVSSPGV